MKNYMMLFLLTAGTCAFAQTPPSPEKKGPSPEQRKERMEAQKIAFITQKLSLTPDEAEKFWPVYNEFTKKNEDLVKKQVDARKGKDINSMSDQDASALIDSELNMQEQRTALLKEYTPKFKAVLPVKKVALLYQAEKEFRMKKKQMMQEHRNKKFQNGQQPPPPPTGK
jgi:hypothetical protein